MECDDLDREYSGGTGSRMRVWAYGRFFSRTHMLSKASFAGISAQFGDAS